MKLVIPKLGSVYLHARVKRPDWRGIGWFNLGVLTLGFMVWTRWPGVYINLPIWLYNAFRRKYEDPRYDCWGFGILQVGGRHLLAVISNEEKFEIDVGFLHLVLVERTPA